MTISELFWSHNNDELGRTCFRQIQVFTGKGFFKFIHLLLLLLFVHMFMYMFVEEWSTSFYDRHMEKHSDS